MHQPTRIATERTIRGKTVEQRAPRTPIGSEAMSIDTELRPGGQPLHAALPVNLRQHVPEFFARRRTHDLQKLLTAVEQLDLLRLRMNRVADAARPRIDLRQRQASLGGMRVDSTHHAADGKRMRHVRLDHIDRKPQTQLRNGIEVHMVTRATASHARIVLPIRELGRCETELLPILRELQLRMPARAILLNNLEPARLRSRVPPREKAYNRMSLQREVSRSRVPHHQRWCGEPDADLTLRALDILDNGFAATTCAGVPLASCRKGNRRVSSRNQPRERRGG